MSAINCRIIRVDVPCLFRIKLAIVTILEGLWLSQCLGQQSANVEGGGGIVKAGETVQFRVTVDKPTNVDGCVVQYTIRSAQVGLSSSVPLSPGQRTVIINYKVPYDAAGGKYDLQNLFFWSPSGKQIPLSTKSISFTVVPNEGVTYPTSADVALIPSQVQLFRSEASNLQTRTQTLKASLRNMQYSRDPKIRQALSAALTESIEALQKTEIRFNQLTPTADQRERAAVFFGDLRLTYSQTRQLLNENLASTSRSGKALMLRLVVLGGQKDRKSIDPSPSLVVPGVLRAFEQNELAYSTVADAGTLSFDLRVASTPEGAGVSYARRGDALKVNPDPTNATINALTFAVWIIHFHKPGYKDEEREYDPFTEHDRIVNVVLQPEGR